MNFNKISTIIWYIFLVALNLGIFTAVGYWLFVDSFDNTTGVRSPFLMAEPDFSTQEISSLENMEFFEHPRFENPAGPMAGMVIGGLIVGLVIALVTTNNKLPFKKTIVSILAVIAGFVIMAILIELNDYYNKLKFSLSCITKKGGEAMEKGIGLFQFLTDLMNIFGRIESGEIAYADFPAAQQEVCEKHFN